MSAPPQRHHSTLALAGVVWVGGGYACWSCGYAYAAHQLMTAADAVDEQPQQLPHHHHKPLSQPQRETDAACLNFLKHELTTYAAGEEDDGVLTELLRQKWESMLPSSRLAALAIQTYSSRTLQCLTMAIRLTQQGDEASMQPVELPSLVGCDTPCLLGDPTWTVLHDSWRHIVATTASHGSGYRDYGAAFIEQLYGVPSAAGSEGEDSVVQEELRAVFSYAVCSLANIAKFIEALILLHKPTSVNSRTAGQQNQHPAAEPFHRQQCCARLLEAVATLGNRYARLRFAHIARLRVAIVGAAEKLLREKTASPRRKYLRSSAIV